MQVSLEWQALQQNKGFFRRTTTWILFRMCTKEETALNILWEERMNVHAPKKFCGIDWTDALRDVLRSLSNALWSLQLCIDLVCIWMCRDLYLSCHPWFARCERVGIYASGIVFCNEFFVLRHSRGIPGHWLWWPIVLFLAHMSFSFVSCIALTSFNLERHGF